MPYSVDFFIPTLFTPHDECEQNGSIRRWQAGKLYTEIKKGGEEIEFYSQRYKQDMKELMKQVVFFRTLLERDATSEYLSQNYPQMVKEVQKILTRSETEVLS